MIKTFYTLIFIVTLASISYGQQSVDTVCKIGNVMLNSKSIGIQKSLFLEFGKVSTNIKGVHVKQFYYSLFALGNSVRGFVSDSVFSKQLIKNINDKHYNYRYVNFEKIVLEDSVGKIIYPKFSTVKIKFIYK